MDKFKAIVLGTDDSSYAIARSYNDAFNDKALVIGSGLLPPFKNSKIADVIYKRGFSSHDDLFVSMLNEACKAYPEETKFVIFAPVEVYLNILSRNLDKLDFDARPAYPLGEIYEKYFYKSNFYPFLEEIGVAYPKTQVLDGENFEDLTLDGELFMKADDFPALYNLDSPVKQKGYRLSGKKEALEILREVYRAGYTGKMLVQEYIEGKDGSEYSLNGYRSHDGKTAMVLARNLYSDKRPLTVGNHLVQVDADIPEMYDLAKKITGELDYVGLFNLDFKVDARTGKIYVFEMNQRQGRTFYYAKLGGVDLVEVAIRDKVFGESRELRPSKKFRMITLSEKVLEEHMDPDLMGEFKDPERVKNTENPNFNPKDKSLSRVVRLKEQIREDEKEIFS